MIEEFLSFKIQPLENYLIGNPIVFELNSVFQDLIRFTIFIDGEEIYSGAFIPTGKAGQYETRISISDLIKPYIKESVISDSDLIITALENGVLPVSIVFTQKESILHYTGNIYKGGIGKKMLRFLKSNNTDIFSYKFLSRERQFFLTTRTSARQIVVKENELSPLFFIATDLSYSVITEYGRSFVFDHLEKGNMYAFNPEILRKKSYELYEEIPAYLKIHIEGRLVAELVIRSSGESSDTCILRFRNSFGAFEKLEVTGDCISEPEFGEDNAFMVYDYFIEDYIEQNNRLEMREAVTADFGYKTLEEFLFMRDMLQSDKRYLIDPKGNEYEVRIKAENFSHDLFPRQPGSVQLKIRLVDSDCNYSPDPEYFVQEWNSGESIWKYGFTDAYGLLQSDSTLNNQ